MGFLGTTFNESNAVENTGNFEPIPAGWYQAQIKSAEVKQTKDGTGKYLNVRYDVLGPTNVGRVIFGMITLENLNQKTVEIGYGQMTELRVSLGMREISKTEDIEGRTLEIKVSIDISEGYKPKNGVKAFKAIAGSQMPKSTVTSQPSSKPAASGVPAWAQKKSQATDVKSEPTDDIPY